MRTTTWRLDDRTATPSSRIPLLIAILTLSFVSIPALAGEGDGTSNPAWVPYPDEMPKFDFQGGKLKEKWDSLTGGHRDPFPDAEELKRLSKKYPALYDQTVEHVLTSQETDPWFEQLVNTEREICFDLYAARVQEVWALLFEGKFQKARDLGVGLGPPGYFPGLYAQVVYANHLARDERRREALYREVMEYAEKYRTLAPDYRFLRVGDSYAKARILEKLSPERALQTSYAGGVLKELDDLLKEDPNNLYAASLLGGVHAGIIEKAGTFLARVYYGSTPEMMEKSFGQAVALYRGYPLINNEYAMALHRVYGKDRLPQAIMLLEEASRFEPRCAEEALEVVRARNLLTEYKGEM